MRSRESYTLFVAAGLGLTLAILVIFQVYIFREPMRIRLVQAADQQAAEEAGQELFADNCATCHGTNGDGGIGPALNSRALLTSTMDETLAGLTRFGVPSSIMPAWGQAFGGPFTDQEINQLVAYMRAWEPTAPEISLAPDEPDPVQGAEIYETTCFICHGEDGQGTPVAPALNDPERLQKFDDIWYRNTIAHGRPAKGMPTWGTVLSPAQINDVIALIAAWREGEVVAAEFPLATFVTNALFAIREFDRPDAVFYLNNSLPLADKSQAQEINAIVTMIEENRLFEAEASLITLLPPEVMGIAAYDSNCAPCHGDDGTGDMGPNLHDSSFIQAKNDTELVEFILAGRQSSAMDGFEGILGSEEIDNIIILMRSWQE
jgi:mono/diheme cytochrome c family protein